jgi:hypothetical protein
MREPVRVTAVSGNGPQPGVDLDDSASLLALMQESDLWIVVAASP